MSDQDLGSDNGLRAACEAVGRPDKAWARGLAETIHWVRAATESERGSREFQQRLWEDNGVAAIGQGNIPIDRALDNPDFRRWLAVESMEPLPASTEDRLRFLRALYEDMKEKLAPFLDRKVPHLKIFRVMAALYPEAMTTVASGGALKELADAMGANRSADPVERHLWVRRRLDALLGDPGDEAEALAERMTLPWMLYERFVRVSADRVVEELATPVQEPRLLPLPATRRIRSLTAIRGMFPGVLSALEFVRDGVSPEEMLDFLRASSPDVKEGTHRVTVNALRSELGAIRRVGERYVLTERGENALESQDASYLADWILTRVLGFDKAIVELRRAPLSPVDLVASIRSMHPGLKSNFGPQSTVSWLRSFGTIEINSESKYSLTASGRDWADRIHWAPEQLPIEADAVIVPPIDPPKPEVTGPVVPALSAILAVVQGAGHFPTDVVARLHSALWAHPRRHFAILTGLSGSGKTLLARSYAASLTGQGANSQLITVPVQPGWYDPGALLGFVNPLRGDSYVETGFLGFLMRAAEDPGRPYVAVLDEMNLSHPEQYMAPLLSAMETGDAIQLHTEGEFFDGVPGAISYPRNLVLIGTVNMDETTHGLSDKVLDRAFVLEFWGVDLAVYPHWGTRRIDPNHETRARDVLTALMEALSPARLHFGWRVVDDVLDFLHQAARAGEALSFEAALDGVIYAKVLPKLRGEDAPRVREAFKRCEEALASFGLKESCTKVAELRRDLETTGSARFWR